MAFAQNTDLQQYAPEVFDQGVDDWGDELALAETDVINAIRINYWNKYETPDLFNSARLTDSQWTKATVYRAMSAYILPKLSTFRPEGDPFMIQLEFYKNRYAEEIETQFALGVEYDHNNDGSVDQASEVERIELRLTR